MQDARKHILIICPDSRHFIKEYISNVFDKEKYKISFLTVSADPAEPFWKDNSVTVYTLKKKRMESRIKALFFSLPRLLAIHRLTGKVDIVHYHYIDYSFTHLINLVYKKKSDKTILTFWGGDVFGVEEYKIRSFASLFKHANVISFMSKELFDTFQKITRKEYEEKSIVLDYGNSTIEGIDNYLKNNSREDAKGKWAFPLDKIIIHIGYNGCIAQQHINIIKVIGNLPNTIRDNVFVVIPLGYGVPNEEYRNEIVHELELCNVEYKIIDEYLSQDKVISFRCTADIFFYGQLTDAISASVIEYLCAGSKIIKPTWLDYSLYSDKGVFFEEYCDFKDAAAVLLKTLNNFDYYNANNNREIVLNLKSWKRIKDMWTEMYE